MTNIFHLDDYATQCPTINITLNNGALASVGQFQGLYQISNQTNGKPSWTLDPYAIWYSLENDWLIGNLDDIGKGVCYIQAKDDYGGFDDANNRWYYWDGNNWILAGANDVNITCTSNNIFLAECSSKNADYKLPILI